MICWPLVVLGDWQIAIKSIVEKGSMGMYSKNAVSKLSVKQIRRSLAGCISMVALLGCTNVVYASDDLDDLLEMDLEELTVSVASKKEERIADAPGIVSVVTAGDIERFGANTLSDVLSYFPNVYNWGSEVFRDNVTSVRGQTLTHIDNTVLILLNGRPMRESNTGGRNQAIYQAFPIDIIQRVEMIRGPGSVLYGSNAFSGVINIITQSAEEADNQVSAGIGSFGTRSYQATGRYQGKELEVVAAGSIRNEDGFDFHATDIAGNTQTIERGERTHAGFFEVGYKQLTFTGFTSFDQIDALGVSQVFPGLTERANRHFFDVQYEQPLTEDWTAKTNVTWNSYRWQNNSPNIARDILLEGNVAGAIGPVNLVLGGSADYHDTIVLGRSSSTRWLSSYVQADYRPLPWLKLISGLQLNEPQDSDTDFSPRFGAIANLNENWTVKLLYGEAFRSPYASETSINLPGILIGSEDLKPEKIATFDAQILYHNRALSTALTFYHSEQTDTIIRQGARPATFTNGGDVDYRGVEWETKWHLDDKWDIIGAVTYQEGEDENDNEDVGLVPHFQGKIGVSYSSHRGYQLSVFNSYFSDSANIEDISNAAVVNPPAESYNWLTANVNLDINQLFELPSSVRPVRLNIYAENLLDETVYFPETIRRQVNTFPLTGGMAFFGKVIVSF